MMNRHVEIRDDGMYTVQDVFDKLIIDKVKRGWHILFTDTEGAKRFGYILQIELEQRQFRVLDVVAYPNAPMPFGVQGEVVSFDAVIIASQGFNWLRDRVIYESGKKVGKRQIAIIIKISEQDADVGWLDRRAGRVYVDRHGDHWQVRSLPSKTPE